eukprot:SAG31_NODE_956_length_10790_cov_34.583107_9_plen_236_part_00
MRPPLPRCRPNRFSRCVKVRLLWIDGMHGGTNVNSQPCQARLRGRRDGSIGPHRVESGCGPLLHAVCPQAVKFFSRKTRRAEHPGYPRSLFVTRVVVLLHSSTSAMSVPTAVHQIGAVEDGCPSRAIQRNAVLCLSRKLMRTSVGVVVVDLFIFKKLVQYRAIRGKWYDSFTLYCCLYGCPAAQRKQPSPESHPSSSEYSRAHPSGLGAICCHLACSLGSRGSQTEQSEGMRAPA